MKNHEEPGNKTLLIIGSIIITILTFYFCVPKFVSIEKYRKLSSRLDTLNEVENNSNDKNQPIKNNGSTTKPNTDPNNSQNNSNHQENNNNDNTNSNSNNSTNPNQNNFESSPNNNLGSNENNNNENPSTNEPQNPVEPPSKPIEEPKPPVIEEDPKVEPSGEKTFTVGFYQNGADKIADLELKCTTKDDSCTIILPTIIKENGIVHGWSINATDTNGLQPGANYTVDHNHYLYAITSKENTATFHSNGATLSFTSKNCTIYNKEKSCSVNTPTITRTGGYGIGFSKDPNATTSSYGKTISINENINLYAISASEYTAYFNPNGALNIGAKSLSCKAYNASSTCTITAPSIEKDSYTTIGWNANSEATTITYQVGSNINLNQNISLHAIRRVNNSGFLIGEAYNGLGLVNNLRRTNGVADLKWSKSLEHSAQLRVLEIINYGYDPNNPHNRPDGREFYTVNDLAYGESWTNAFSASASEMYNNFFVSAPHKAAMLNSNYKTIGIAGCQSPKNGEYYWVQLFGY